MEARWRDGNISAEDMLQLATGDFEKVEGRYFSSSQTSGVCMFTPPLNQKERLSSDLCMVWLACTLTSPQPLKVSNPV